ncbi:MAG: hypothetical protein ACKO38_15990 [Planctomycetota bacterium]
MSEKNRERPASPHPARDLAGRDLAGRDLAARFAFLFAGTRPPERFESWFDALSGLDGVATRACLRSELGSASRFTIRQVSLGPSSHLLAVIRRDRSADKRPDHPVDAWREWLWPSDDLPPTDIVYDCGEEILHGKAKPILCDLKSAPIRVFVIVPTQVERLTLSGENGRVAIAAADASGRVVEARLPFHVRPATGGLSSGYAASDASGWLTVPVERRSKGGDSPEQIIRVRSLLNGLTAVVRVRREQQPEMVDELWDPQPLQWQ